MRDGEGLGGAGGEGLREERGAFAGVRRHGQEGESSSASGAVDAVVTPARPTACPQCGLLKEKLDLLLRTLTQESEASRRAGSPLSAEDGGPPTLAPPLLRSPAAAAAAIFKPREQLMLRANSLKKVIRQIIEHAEKGQLPACAFRPRFRAMESASLFPPLSNVSWPQLPLLPVGLL